MQHMPWRQSQFKVVKGHVIIESCVVSEIISAMIENRLLGDTSHTENFYQI